MDVTGIHSLFKLMWRKPTNINYKKCASYLDGSRSKRYAAVLVERGYRKNEPISRTVEKYPGDSLLLYQTIEKRLNDYFGFEKQLGRKPATRAQIAAMEKARFDKMG